MGLIVRDKKLYWPDGCVPYQIDIDPHDLATTYGYVTQAIENWNELDVGIRLIKRTTQTNYVSFQSSGGDVLNCTSAAGMTGGLQVINVPTQDSESLPCRIEHEIGHALGFKHEHQRSDRDNYVTIDMSNVESIKAYNFWTVSDSAYIRVGSYDYDSIMHYGDTAMAANKDEPVFIPPPHNGYEKDIGASSFSDGDKKSAKELVKGNSHVYKLAPNGEINHPVDMRQWTDGWTTSLTFTIGTKQFLFLLKASDGRMHVNEINGDGSVGKLVDNQDWSSGWTSAAIYTIWGANYLFLLKRSNGIMHVNKINSDGTIGPIIDTADWASGWSSVATYGIGGTNYLFLLKENSGTMHVNRINWDGTIGSIVDKADWTSGWTSAAIFSIFGTNYLFLLKNGDGTMHVNRINGDGTIGKIIDNRDWSAGWTTAKTFAISGSNFLFLLKKGNGRMHLHQINGDGSIGPRIDQRIWSSGWTTVSPYSTSQGSFLSLIKA